ncbi:ABC transporter permease [Arthrobacter oryzae]|uniref:Spermidine/putrescine transport system permease protein PotC n=1 Tax=Arthrobacter oryzae TaxID=409290 RepID=A0A495ESX9_9MICC|nr:ABC transporter permease [Arthrobacter oryzae]RKR20100.1 ABC-type spermidine/putrescine transport system permease subunit II [Arthrobacter oryzae]
MSRGRPTPTDGVSIGLWTWGIIVFIFLFAPIITIVVYSFNAGRTLVVWDGFSLDPYVRAMADPTMASSVLTSIKAALGSAAFAAVIGTLAGIAAARRPGKWAAVFLVVVTLVLITPEIVDAIALLIWFVRMGGPFGPDNQFVDYGLMRLWFGHAIFSTAVVVLIVRARVSGMDESLEEAAADLYAPPWRRFRQITLPLVFPAVMVGFLLSFSLSLDNTIISSFVSVAGSTPWPVYVFSAVRGTLRPELASMSTVMLLLTVLSLAAVGFVLRRGGGSSSELTQALAGGKQ